MPQGKKFGTFAGVFTPSILTILGVIMYMRLSWVVGNAGLQAAIFIILIAHIVSVSTGLSVSSVATDRKIKAGGIYYMLSRSLGLPIGGSIGITLFVATALSIALYLIGFAESALVVLQEPFGIEKVTINHIRIAGSLALFLIVTIAYISTSIAIKSQFFILAAIVLSVVSILLGTETGKTFDMSVSPEGGVNFFVLFGIFFPAVTGFTAGVAMSGDLQDPKKSIPWGTMLAVGTGLIVYLALAVFIYYSIDLEVLKSDKNALIKFGWIPALVIGGIWGATLSSALGGILGAPRILQAMSVDSITPKLFAKGVGVDNEPRRALILTFVIAQAGILIGELDVIAEVVAMFYLAAYLFINISCFLEQWASPDFRPSFKIPIWVSLLGAIVTFVLMIQLNLLAAVVAILVMMLIFIWLTRKELVLGSGDVWQSVWSSIVKLGLKNLDKKSTHKRNWNPNILLFSGGTETRNRLIEFSKTVAGNKGMISNFELIENKTAKLLFPKHKQSIKDDELYSQGIFARKQECKNVYDGIEAIASTYGFSGVEPNTILTSWERSSQEPTRFAQLTNKLCELDYNVLYLDYDKQRGFGSKKSIDIWWSDFSNTTELTLNLAKFMNSSIDWRQAQLRILYVNEENDKKIQLEEIINTLVSNYRLNAKTKIINNELEKKELYEIMKVESYDSDLVIVGVPDHLDDEEKFVEKTDELVKILGTTLLVKASSHFEETEVNLEEEKEIIPVAVEEEETEIEIETNIGLNTDSFSFPWLNNLRVFNQRNTNYVLDSVFAPIHSKYLSFLTHIEITLQENKNSVDKQFSSNKISNVELLDSTFKRYITQLSDDVKSYNEEFLSQNEIAFKDSISALLEQNSVYHIKLPKKILRELSQEELQIVDGDTKSEQRAKKWISFKKKRLGISPSRKIRYRDFVAFYYQNFYLKIFAKNLNQGGIFIYKNTTLINLLSDDIKDAYYGFRNRSKAFTKEEFDSLTTQFITEIQELKLKLQENYKVLSASFTKLNLDYIYSLSNKLDLLSINEEIEEKTEEKGSKEFKKQVRVLNSFPAYFKRNSKLINNAVLLDISLHEIHPEIDKVINDTTNSINRLNIKPQLVQINMYKKLDASLTENTVNSKLELIRFINRLPLFSFDIEELVNVTIKKVEKIVYKLTNSLDIMDVESLNNFNELQGSEVKLNTIQLQKLILFSVENKLIKSLNQESDNLQNDLNELMNGFKNKSITLETIDFENETDLVVQMRAELADGSKKLADAIQTRFKNYVSKVEGELEETYKLLDYDFIASNSQVINKYIKKTGVATSKFSRF
ncbi:MAG: amino acid permease, partial [Flavobacteriales bacterium]